MWRKAGRLQENGAGSAAAGGIVHLRTFGVARTGAAVVGEVLDQAVHCLEVGAIADVATLALTLHQTGMHQLLQMEGQRRAGNALRLTDVTSHAACSD